MNLQAVDSYAPQLNAHRLKAYATGFFSSLLERKANPSRRDEQAAGSNVKIENGVTPAWFHRLRNGRV
jgi:hypothetical protein